MEVELTPELKKKITKPTTRKVTAWLFIMATLIPPVIVCLGYMLSVFALGRVYNSSVLIFLGITMLLYFFVSFAGFFMILETTIAEFVRLKRIRKYTE